MILACEVDGAVTHGQASPVLWGLYLPVKCRLEMGACNDSTHLFWPESNELANGPCPRCHDVGAYSYTEYLHANSNISQRGVYLKALSGSYTTLYCIVCTYICTYLYLYICTYNTYIHTYVCTCIHTYVCTCIHTHVRTYVDDAKWGASGSRC